MAQQPPFDHPALRWVGLGVLAALACFPLSGQASPLLAQADGGQVTRNTAFFQKAKKELPETYYFLYRVVDRLARANNLDQNPWRIKSIPEYDMNAYATEVNLIAVYSGLLDVLAGDADAMACVIGHEMAHHVERHIPQKTMDLAKAKQRLEERKQELIRKEQNRQSAAQGWWMITGILRGATGVDVPINPVAPSNPDQMRQDLENAAEGEEQNLATASQRHELEADRVGYQYMTRAGFDPRGCLRLMAVLGRMPNAEFDGSHPAIPRRVKQLEALMVEIPSQPLAAEGRARLQGTGPLTYAVSQDQKSLRVNSRFGSSRGGFVMSDL